MAENRFGMLYVITRIALAVLIIIQLVLLVVGIFSCRGCNVGSIIWFIFAALVLLIGLLAAWREHFLTALVFAIAEVVLTGTGYMAAGWVVVGSVLCLVCSIGFAVMLYMSGSRDMGVPQIC